MNGMLQIHHIMEHSTVNGPGTRFVIWTQGCPFKCDGCFNPATHNLNGGTETEIEKLAIIINQTKDIRGITLSGGEPLLQAESVCNLLDMIDKKLDVLLFSGFTFDEVKSDECKMRTLYKVDATLLGRYNKNLPHPFYGKKLVIHGNKIKKEELKPWYNTEIIVDGNNISVTGLY